MMTRITSNPVTSPLAATTGPPILKIPFNSSPINGLPQLGVSNGSTMGPSSASQFHTNPPTPTATNSSAPSNVIFQRSQSLDNLQQFQEFLSSPNSIQHSRAATPPEARVDHFADTQIFQQSPNMTAENARLITDALQYGNGAINAIQTPFLLELTPDKGSISGGTKVTCLGAGLSSGLQIMFGSAAATNATCWADTTLTCHVPPAISAGRVLVTLRYSNGSPVVSPRPVYFTYSDDDQTDMMKRMFAVIGRSPALADAADFTRYVLAYNNGMSSHNPMGPSPGTGRHRQAAITDQQMSVEEFEVSMMRCLDFIDMDDSPRRANLNYRGPTGQSMLHLSASLGLYRVAAGLLARGANPDLRDNNGMSPMHMASLRGHVRIIRKLRAVGGDPTLRSLNGFTPADMAVTLEAQHASSAIENHPRPRSAAATPFSSLSLSRTGSLMSRASAKTDQLGYEQVDTQDAELYSTPAPVAALSRRSSSGIVDSQVVESIKSIETDSYPLALQSAINAWREQLSAQIQQVQQTFNKALPLLPNLPDYQGYPVVRRISSLVPQRVSPSTTLRPGSGNNKEAEYHWWELLTGTSPAPPAYEDIYPEQSDSKQDAERLGLLRAAADAVIDQKCETAFDQAGSSSEMETINISSQGVTSEQRERLRAAHARKVKRLRSDRNLFFIWVSLYACESNLAFKSTDHSRSLC